MENSLWSRWLAPRLDGLHRDARMVLLDLVGPRPAPFANREPLPRHRHRAPVPLAVATRPVQVREVRRETADATTLLLQCPQGRPFAFTPGQFLTLLVPLPDGEVARRAYSLSLAPQDLPAHQVAITVKRVPGGRVSGHLHEHLRPGDTLRALGPSGAFTLRPDPAIARDLVLLGGGCGVTPLHSLARAVLQAEPRSRVCLIYGNRSMEDILFRGALADLAAAHPERLILRHVLESPPPGWVGDTGRLDEATCARLLAALPPPPPGLLAPAYFLCGPDGMREAARAALLARGVAAAAIHEERFASLSHPAGAPLPRTAQPLALRGAGAPREIMVQPGQTLLEAALAGGVPLPYSCAMGGCGSCKVRLQAGAVRSDEPNCLSAAEREQGYVLACVSRPLSATTVELP